jgi:hypothetical protein
VTSTTDSTSSISREVELTHFFEAQKDPCRSFGLIKPEEAVAAEAVELTEIPEVVRVWAPELGSVLPQP